VFENLTIVAKLVASHLSRSFDVSRSATVHYYSNVQPSEPIKELAFDSLFIKAALLCPEGLRKMVKSLMRLMPRTPPSPKPPVSLRSVRPSLLDLRFTGDPWVVDHADGTASVRLDDYRLARIQTMPFDVPSLNQLLLQLRLWETRRRFYQQLRVRRQQQVSCQLLQPIQ
jgi:hypothetical protein